MATSGHADQNFIRIDAYRFPFHCTSPLLGGFGYVICCSFFKRMTVGQVLIVNIIGFIQVTGNGRFGMHSSHSSTSFQKY